MSRAVLDHRVSRAVALIGALALAGLAIACPSQKPLPVPPGEPAPTGGWTPPDSTPAPAPTAAPATPLEPRADGAECLTSGDCASGVCEGMGCDDDEPGVCVPRDRPCTADAAPYCGCDGETFAASTTCPATRYLARGACP